MMPDRGGAGFICVTTSHLNKDLSKNKISIASHKEDFKSRR